MITKQDIEYLIQIHGEPDYVGMIDLAHFLKRPSKKEYPTYLNILLNTVLSSVIFVFILFISFLFIIL